MIDFTARRLRDGGQLREQRQSFYRGVSLGRLITVARWLFHAGLRARKLDIAAR